MNSVQAFLLEVIVERMDLREKAKPKGKTVGFSEPSGLISASRLVAESSKGITSNVSSKSTVEDRRKSGPPPQCSLTITFGDMVPIVITEDSQDFPGNEIRKKDPKELQTREAEEAKEREDKQHARAAGLSYMEYRNTKQKNPELLSEKRFSKGKSCIFRMRPTELIRLLQTEKLNLTVEGGWTFSMDLGTAAIDFPADSIQAIILAAYSTSMREMIAREGHIWWPPQLYRAKMLKDVKEAQRILEQKKAMELSKEEEDLAVRFKNLCDLPPLPKPCKMCAFYDDPCNHKPITYADIAPPKKQKKKMKIDRKGPAWLMYPSPEPIKPPPLPTFAETTEVVDVIDETKNPTAIVSLFIRLSCFGNSLELNRRPDPYPFPD